MAFSLLQYLKYDRHLHLVSKNWLIGIYEEGFNLYIIIRKPIILAKYG